MRLGRRQVAGGTAALAAAMALRTPAFGQAANQWFAVTGDDGHPVPNQRVPVELAGEVEELPGAIWGGGGPTPAVTLACFTDFNCPWCRAADRDLPGLMRANPDLRVGLLQNPILSPASVEAARVMLALLNRDGARAAHGLRTRLFALPGTINGERALEAVGALGSDRAAIAREAETPMIRDTLDRQMRLAASLGLTATPSYVVGGAAVLGYPGPASLARIVTAARSCGAIAC